jgi:hypothetical protein
MDHRVRDGRHLDSNRVQNESTLIEIAENFGAGDGTREKCPIPIFQAETAYWK